MEAKFKFEIGEIVTTKESVFMNNVMTNSLDEKEKDYRKAFGKRSFPVSIMIASRWMEECPGGVQLHYNCQYYTPQGYVVSKMLEETLVPYPEELKALAEKPAAKKPE